MKYSIFLIFLLSLPALSAELPESVPILGPCSEFKDSKNRLIVKVDCKGIARNRKHQIVYRIDLDTGYVRDRSYRRIGKIDIRK